MDDDPAVGLILVMLVAFVYFPARNCGGQSQAPEQAWSLHVEPVPRMDIPGMGDRDSLGMLQ